MASNNLTDRTRRDLYTSFAYGGQRRDETASNVNMPTDRRPTDTHAPPPSRTSSLHVEDMPDLPTRPSSHWDDHQIQARESQEMRDLDDALARSRHDQGRSISQQDGTNQQSSTAAAAGSKVSSKSEDTLDARIAALQKGEAMALPLLTMGDTLVFLDPAPRHQGQDEILYSHYKDRCQRPHRVHSENLLALNSERITKLFGPTPQHRVKRKRLNNKLPEGVKYVIDLSLQNEGDEAVSLLTGLSCSLGLRTWFKSANRWRVSSQRVSGLDELDTGLPSSKSTPPKSAILPSTSASNAQKLAALIPASIARERPPTRILNWDGNLPKPPVTEVSDDRDFYEPNKESHQQPAVDVALKQTPSNKDLPVDYSTIRHRAAIERMLHAIEGTSELAIDSAPKLWTLVGVAKYFGCADLLQNIKNSAVAWCYAEPNGKFIECNPEAALQMGNAVKSAQLYQDAFAILVGENALLEVSKKSADAREPQFTVHGRKREALGVDNDHDAESQRGEYATKAFVEKIKSKWYHLGVNMDWLTNIAACQQLVNFQARSKHEQDCVEALLNALKIHIVTFFDFVFSCNIPTTPLKHTATFREDQSEGIYPETPHEWIYSSLSPEEKIFTRTFWELVASPSTDSECWHQDEPKRTFAAAEEAARAYNDMVARSADSDTTRQSAPQAKISNTTARLSSLTLAQSSKNSRPSAVTFSSPPKRRKLSWESSSSSDDDDDDNDVPTSLPIRSRPGPSGGFSYLAATNTTTDPFTSDPTNFPTTPAFALDTALKQIHMHIQSVCNTILAAPLSRLDLQLTDTLLCYLSDDLDFKYLPLWAGGNDDGTGGVFNDEIPSLESGGFSTPGPNVHTGGSSAASSDAGFSMVNSDTTTRMASGRATDGYSDDDVVSQTSGVGNDGVWKMVRDSKAPVGEEVDADTVLGVEEEQGEEEWDGGEEEFEVV